ncbi:MAG: peptidase MA family metallohydrolase [Gemmatimonadales bacterium]
MGRVTAVAWPGQGTLATALAAAADRATAFPGIGPLPGERSIRLILAPSRSAYDSLTRGRLPLWSEGAAFPDPGVVVLRSDRSAARLSAALRHELAHLALRWRVGRGLPLWFEEGYAAVAAGEWDRLDALRLNWHVARGMRMNLDEVDRALRGGAAEAQAAYGLATTAVLLLQRWGGPHGLAPLVDRLGREPGFDAALRATYYLTEGDFEARWQRDVASRYGWLGWIQAAGLFWAAAAVVLVWLARRRRRRDRARRALLDEGWELPPDTPTP